MRIGIDYTPALNQNAGVGRYVRSLVQAVTALDGDDKFVLFYGHERRRVPPQPFSDRKNVIPRPIGLSPRVLNIIWYKLGIPFPVDFLTGPIDVFHSPDFTLPPVRHAASIVTIHDLSFLLHPECAEAGLRAHLERVVPFSVRTADFVTADSLNTRNDLVVLLDVPPDKVDVIPGGIDDRFHPIDDTDYLQKVRNRYNLNFPFILFVGTIEPRKNLGRLIQAYVQLRRDQRITHRLVLAGGLGWLYQDILQTIDEHTGDDGVIFLGRVNDDDLPALYNLADMFVFPSLYEGFGLPPLEAMACGVPTICSNSSSLPEVVGDAGLLVPPLDVDGLAFAIESLCKDPDQRAELRRRGLERAESFSWTAAAEKLLAVYRRFQR